MNFKEEYIKKLTDCKKKNYVLSQRTIIRTTFKFVTFLFFIIICLVLCLPQIGFFYKYLTFSQHTKHEWWRCLVATVSKFLTILTEKKKTIHIHTLPNL